MWYMPFVGAGAGIGSSAAGLAMSAVKDSAMQKKQYHYNLKLQRQAQIWQERMSSTAHQRQVADLRAAGLNPILSATGGQGASFSNASGSSVSAPSSSASGGIIEGVNAASQLSNAEANLKNATSTEKLNDALVETQKTQQALNVAKTQETIARADEIGAGLPFERFVTNSAKKFKSFVSDFASNPLRFLPPQVKQSFSHPVTSTDRKVLRYLQKSFRQYPLDRGPRIDIKPYYRKEINFK